MTAIGKLNPNSTIKEYVKSLNVNAATTAANVTEVCTICGGKMEDRPMMRGVCYDCYRDLVTTMKEPETVTDLTRAAYGLGRENLGTHMIISGGEVMEIEENDDDRDPAEAEDDYLYMAIHQIGGGFID